MPAKKRRRDLLHSTFDVQTMPPPPTGRKHIFDPQGKTPHSASPHYGLSQNSDSKIFKTNVCDRQSKSWQESSSPPRSPFFSHFENLVDPPFNNPTGMNQPCAPISDRKTSTLGITMEADQGTAKPDWQVLPPSRERRAFARQILDWQRLWIRASQGANLGRHLVPSRIPCLLYLAEILLDHLDLLGRRGTSYVSPWGQIYVSAGTSL